MTALEFSDENVLSKFDKLASIGIISYGPSKPVPMIDEGFQFELRICPTWSKKPLTVDDALPTREDEVEPERFGPGSDIFKSHPDQVIATVNNTHTLALNIFPVFRPQFLLLSLDSFRSQNEPMGLEDIDASWKFLHSTTLPHFVMYNCTKEAGCSRYHKHMQILRKPEVANSHDTGFRFFPDLKDSKISVPYVYFLHYFSVTALGDSTDSAAILDIYLGLLKRCRKALDIPEDDPKALCPHNVLLVKEWIVVIPRQRGSVQGIGANSAGMMGMPTISNEKLLETWMNIGPAKVLRELGVPAGSPC